MMVRISALSLLLWIGAVPFASAQSFPYDVDTRPKRGIQPDASGGRVDSIDPVSGSLRLDIPIVSLPPGPTGGGFDLRLSYSSAIVDLGTNLYEPMSGPLEVLQFLTPDNGWRFNFENYRIETEWHVMFDYSDFDNWCAMESYKPRMYRVRLGLGDGGMHVLHLYGYGDQVGDAITAEGFYPYSLYGWAGCTEPSTPSPDDLNDTRRTYFTSDGTFLKFEIGPGVDDPTVFLPDGSQIDVSLDFAADVATEWDPFVLRDPNGNEVEIYKGCDEYCENLYVSIRDQYWEEESDREIRINFVETENEPTDYEIFAPGSGGAVEWTVDFEYVTTPAGDKEFECSSGEYCGVGSYTRASVEHISVPSSPATTYTFEYNNGEAGWGEIISMTVPSGAEYTYDYEDLETRPQGELTRNRVESRTVGHDSESDTWTYEYDSEESTTKTTAPDGGETVHHIDSQNRVWKVDRPNGSATERVFDTNPVPGITSFTTDPNNSFVEKLLVTIGDDAGDPTLTTITEFEYDRNGNPTSRVEYDWVAYPGTTGTTELRTTTFDYVFPHPAMGSTADIATGYWREHHSTYWSGDLDPRRMNAVQRVTVSEDGTTPLAVTEFEYDDAYGTGNVTAEEHWDSEKAGTVPSLGNLSSASARVIMRTYNSLGQVTEVDGGTVNTEITYGTIPTGSGPGPYPTLVEYAPGTGIARTFSFDWDYGTGFLDAETDDDNSIETAYTYDALGRTLTVDEDGVRQTETVYDDEDRLVITKSDLAAYQDGKLQSAVHYDQLGRVIRTRVTDGSALSTSPSATDGINVQTIYTTVSGGNRVVTSTPYRTTSDPTLEWGCTTYDLSGRVILSSAFTGSTAPTDCASTSSRTAHAEIVYDGNRIETTDPAAKKREEYRDALGRIVQVVEDPGGTLDYETDYAYDPVGNLLTVDQGVQTRTFEYSSLSLLLSADNAESGETGYTYQPDGSLATVTDARGIVSSYTYDALGRITAKSYGDGTPAVGYSYFTSGAPNIGQLHRVSSSTAVETFNGYDVLGRVTSHTQSIFPGSTAYTMAYTYWLDDSIATMTYPSGREVAYSVDDAGRPRIVSDGTTTYADLSNATSDYAPDGRPARMELGNELWETREFRPAGTTTTLKLGTTSGGSEKLKLEYDYQPEGMGLESNGNLTSHVITHPGSAWTQSFTYDEINRLASATETSGFSRDYGYDQYGNRWIASSTGPYHSDTHEPTSSTNFSTATNRLTVASSTYDDAGNQTYFAPYTLAFDAENRVVSAKEGATTRAVYLYDGDGRRVSKTWNPGGGPPEVTHYVYDIAGRNIAEYSSEPPETDETLWLFTDILGSVRAITGEKPPMDPAPVVECYDYLPFGRMLTDQDNGRSGPGCYPGSPATYTSDVEEKFTGQKRDEVLLDDFIARYYSGAQGRFTSADLPFIDQYPGDPQSWNMYAYVRNNPLRFVDPTGFACEEREGGLPRCDHGLFELWLAGIRHRAREAADVVAEAATDLAEIVGEHHKDVQFHNAVKYAEMNLCIELYGWVDACFGELQIGMIPVLPGAGGIFGAARGSTTVYRSLNAAGEVRYVGITNNLARRAAEHLRSSGIQIEKLMGGLSRNDARALEQALIQIHGLGRTGGTLLNRINSVAPSSPAYAEQLRRGYELLKRVGY